jgi:fatty aldehyde-generating acyl-ACP reductase
MGNQSADIDFALIGHQDCWKKITGFVDFLGNGSRSLPAQKISEVYSFIPPRNVFDIEIKSITGQKAKGCYIETFISPDELGVRYWKKNVVKVNDAAACARKLNANIASLGGFTSIVLEGRNDTLNDGSVTKFTTGNSLTAAFIVKGVEKACMKFNKQLEDQQLLVIGATGDIGSACVQYFSGKVKKLLLCARQHVTLQEMKKELTEKGLLAEASTDVTTLLPDADIIIAIASSAIQNFHSSLCKKM